MDLTLDLILQSPLMAGAGRKGGNYGDTLKYVPGRVLRAAFARAILAQCPYFEPHQQTNGRRFWVSYRGEEGCARCPWQRWCRHFSEIRFRDATVDGAEVYPATAMGCKYHPDHRPVDALAAWLRAAEGGAGAAEPPELRCPECSGEGRVEARRGEQIGGRAVEAPLTTLTHVGIHPARQAAEEGVLFSVRAIQPFTGKTDQDRRSTRLLARLTVPDSEGAAEQDWGLPPTAPRAAEPGEDASGDCELSVGAKTGAGMGLCHARVRPVDTPAGPPLKERLAAFNARIGSPSGRWYAPLLLTADAQVPLAPQQQAPSSVSTGEFLATLAGALGLNADGWELAFAYADHAYRGGWDTSRPAGQRYQEAALYLLRGSVLVLRRQGPPDEAALARLTQLEAAGVGERTADGQGQVAVCHPFHIDYAFEG